MKRRPHASAYSSAQEQAAQLQEWKQRNSAHTATSHALRRKIDHHKVTAAVGKKRRQWIQERDRLRLRQTECEESLATSLEALRPYMEVDSIDECEQQKGRSGELWQYVFLSVSVELQIAIPG